MLLISGLALNLSGAVSHAEIPAASAPCAPRAVSVGTAMLCCSKAELAGPTCPPTQAAPQGQTPSPALQWLSVLTPLLSALAWPLVALLLAFGLRRELVALLGRVRQVEMGQGRLILDREFKPAPVERQREKSRQEVQEAEGEDGDATGGFNDAQPSQPGSPGPRSATPAPSAWAPKGDPLLAEALALRALQEEYGVPIGRQLAAGEGPVFDGVFALGERLYIVEVKLYRKRVASAKLSATLAALAQTIRARGWQHTRIVLAAVFDQPDDLSTQLALLHAAADATPSVPVIVRCFTLADLQRRFDAQGAESAQAPPSTAP